MKRVTHANVAEGAARRAPAGWSQGRQRGWISPTPSDTSQYIDVHLCIYNRRSVKSHFEPPPCRAQHLHRRIIDVLEVSNLRRRSQRLKGDGLIRWLLSNYAGRVRSMPPSASASRRVLAFGSPPVGVKRPPSRAAQIAPMASGCDRP